MTPVTILAIVIVVGLPLLVALSKLYPRVDRRPNMQVEQEAQGVGADQKEEPEGERGTSPLG